MTEIDNFATPGNPVVDITGSTLNIVAIYTPQGQPTPTTQPLSAIEAVLPPNLLSPADTTFLATPLSQTFDTQWANLLPTVKANIISSISTNSPSQYPAYNINVTNLPETGNLRAIVVSGEGSTIQPNATGPDTIIYLSFEVNNIAASWTAHNTQADELLLFEDATFNLTFNVAVLIQIIIPAEASISTFPLAASTAINNANIQPSNYVAYVESIAADVYNFFNDQPPIFQAPDGAIDSAGGSVGIDTSSFSSLLAGLSNAWLQAVNYGFTILTAVIEPQAPYPEQLVLQFKHPSDPAPIPVNLAVSSYPSLIGPEISTVSEAQAGESIYVLGINFPLNTSANIYVGWTDTVSGNVTASLIRWGPVGGTQAIKTIPRTGAYDNKNMFNAQNLTPGAQYDFAIQDQDALTETPFTTPPVPFSTTATGEVQFVLNLGSLAWVVASTNLTNNASFNIPILLPSTLSSGLYTLTAKLSGISQASTQLQIVAAGQALTPALQVQGTPIDPVTGQSEVTNVSQGSQLTLVLIGFLAGPVSIYIGGTTGTLLTTTTSTGPSPFTTQVLWPGGVSSSTVEYIVAQGSSGQTAQAPVEVLIPPK